MVIAWNTGAAATEWRYNHKLKTKYLKVVRTKATSRKRQASSKKDLDSHKIPDIR